MPSILGLIFTGMLMAGAPGSAGAGGPADVPSASATTEDITAEVAWGCIQSPNEVLHRLRGSAFKPRTEGWALPRAASASPTACVTCDMSINTGPACAWRDASGSHATMSLAAKRCSELDPHDVFGAIDLATLWQGWLVQAPSSSVWPQISRRLGMGEVAQLCFDGHLTSPNTWHADILLRAKSTPRGLFSALGPAVPAQLAPEVGLAAAHSISASVYPARLWNLFETLAAGVAPLQYTLLRVQLDSIERAVHIRWADDVLGNQPAVWTLYQPRGGDWVGVLGGADGERAVTFLAAAVEGLADLLPGLQIKVFKKAVTTATLTVPSGSLGNGGIFYFAFLPHRVVMATSERALAPHLKKRDRAGQAPALRASPATVFGTLDAGVAAPWMRLLPVRQRPPVIKNARGAWFFAQDPQGWRGSVEMTVERQTFGQ